MLDHSDKIKHYISSFPAVIDIQLAFHATALLERLRAPQSTDSTERQNTSVDAGAEQATTGDAPRRRRKIQLDDEPLPRTHDARKLAGDIIRHMWIRRWDCIMYLRRRGSISVSTFVSGAHVDARLESLVQTLNLDGLLQNLYREASHQLTSSLRWSLRLNPVVVRNMQNTRAVDTVSTYDRHLLELLILCGNMTLPFNVNCFARR